MSGTPRSSFSEDKSTEFEDFDAATAPSSSSWLSTAKQCLQSLAANIPIFGTDQAELREREEARASKAAPLIVKVSTYFLTFILTVLLYATVLAILLVAGIASLALFLTLILAVPVGIGFGIYLSTLLAPLIIGALLASGLAPWAALSLGIAASCGLIFASVSLLMLVSSVIKGSLRITKLIEYGVTKTSQEKTFIIFSILSVLAASAFGIYLAVLIFPAILTMLAAAGIATGLAMFIAIATSFLLVSATIDVFCQPAILMLLKLDFSRWLELARPEQWIRAVYLVSGATGVGLGIYLSLLLAPLLMPALTAISGVNLTIATFIMLATSLALLTLMARVISAVCTSCAGIFVYFDTKETRFGKPKPSANLQPFAAQSLAATLQLAIMPEFMQSHKKSPKDLTTVNNPEERLDPSYF